jgi:hypothetical protein
VMLPEDISRELVNGTLFVLEIQMVLVFVTYIVRGHRADTSLEAAMHWYDRPRVQAAVALAVFITGSMLRAVWVWTLMLCDSNRVSCHYFPIQHDSYGFLVFSTWIALVGGVCVIRVFTPPEWQPWPWILAFISSVSVPLLTYLYV